MANAGKRDKSESVRSAGSTLDVPALLGDGLRTSSLERNGRAEADGDLGSDFGASSSLLGSSSGGGQGVLDFVPKGLRRWRSFHGVSFGGVYACQYWCEFILWEALLNERLYTGIVELGTFRGGFSLYLAAQAQTRDMFFRTYDIHRPEHAIPGFVRIDIFAQAREIGEHMARHEPLIVLCDGGNKPRELATFSRYVTDASTLVVHDWGTEFLPSDIPSNVEMVHGEFCDDLGSLSRVFRVTI